MSVFLTKFVFLFPAAPATSSTSSHAPLTSSSSVTSDRDMVMDRIEMIITNNAEIVDRHSVVDLPRARHKPQYMRQSSDSSFTSMKISGRSIIIAPPCFICLVRNKLIPQFNAWHDSSMIFLISKVCNKIWVLIFDEFDFYVATLKYYWVIIFVSKFVKCPPCTSL